MEKLSLNFVIMKLRNFGFEPTYHNDGWSEKIVIDDLGIEATESARSFVGRQYPEIVIKTR